jgi:hypothetical protein
MIDEQEVTVTSDILSFSDRSRPAEDEPPIQLTSHQSTDITKAKLHDAATLQRIFTHNNKR